MTVFPNQNDDTADADNPVDKLADLIDALDVHVTKAERAVRRSEGNRVGILYVHALFALMIAPAFAAIGVEGMRSPTWSVMRLVPGAPYSMSLVMFLGGLVLTVATTLANRAWEIIGLTLLMTWYAVVSFSFGGSVLLWLVDNNRGAAPSFYAPLVYAHFLTIMLVHTHTLRKMLRESGRRP